MDKLHLLLSQVAEPGKGDADKFAELVKEAESCSNSFTLAAIQACLNTEVDHQIARAKGIRDDAVADGRPEVFQSEKRNLDRIGDTIERLQAIGSKFARQHRSDLRATGHVQPPSHQAEPTRRDGYAARPGALTLLRSGQSMADFVRATSWSDASEPMSFGEIARAMVTGRRDNLNDAEQRAMGEGLIAGGGILVPDYLSAEIVDLARNQTAVMKAGAVLIPMAGPELTIARLTADPTAEWLAENASQTASDGTFGGFQLVAKHLRILAKCSLELIEDSPNAAQVIEDAFAAAIALELDRAALLGAGVNGEPRGLYTIGSVHSRTTNSGAGEVPTSWDWAIDALSDIWGSNGVPNALIYNSRTATTLAKFKAATTNEPLALPKALDGIARLVTNQIGNAYTIGAHDHASMAFAGDFSKLGIGMRIGFEFAASREAGDSTGGAFSSAQVWLRGRLRADIVALQPTHFSIVKGLLEV